MKKLLFLALLLIAAQASAQMYRWVDNDGKVHYTDSPPPAADAKSVERKKLTPSIIETSQLPYEVQQAARNFPVTLYTSPSCAKGCPEARELLQKRGVPFKEVSVFDEATNALLKKASSAGQVPTVIVGSQATVGYEPGAINALLDSAGYPKSAVIPSGAAKAQATTPAKSGDAEKAKPASGYAALPTSASR